jgi:hypothetical protein
MFRDGLLPPWSKLFAATQTLSSLIGELAGVDTRSMSSASQTSLAPTHSAASMTSNVSLASNMTKSGLFKGERDTSGGGIGPATELG